MSYRNRCTRSVVQARAAGSRYGRCPFMGRRGFSMDRPVLGLAQPRVGFRHEAFFYADEDEFLAGTSSFVRDGLESDEPTLVVLNAAKLDLLRSELKDDADRVFFADMGEVGR